MIYTELPCRLPNELMFAIFELLAADRFSLAKLLLLNRAFQTIIEQILYRRMTHWLGSYSQELFIRTVLRNPRLGSYVKSFAIIDYRVATAEWQVREANPLWDDMAICIESMTNLKELIIDMNWSNVPLRKLLPAFTKLDVQAFTWTGKGLKDTQTIVKFLGQNYWSNLEALKINLDGVPVGELIDADWCPRLIRLEGDTSAVKEIMPGRFIQELGWYPEMEMSVGAISEELAEALGRVRALCVSFLMAFEHVMLGGYLPSVQHLRILHAEQVQAFMPRLLRHIPHLWQLAVDSTSGYWPIGQVYSMCSNLECIYVMRPGYPVEEDKYDRDPLNVDIQYYRCIPERHSVKCGRTTRSAGYHVEDDYVKVDGSMNFRHYLSFKKHVDVFQADDYINTLQYGYSMQGY